MIHELNNAVRYIGVDDTDLDLFESQYIVPQGISYNSYIIRDEKIAILDTCDARKADEWQSNLKEALEGASPDYLVVHHMEPDHSGLVKWTMDHYSSCTLVCSAAAAKMLKQFCPESDFSERTQLVKEGDILALGEHKLKFIGAPMVHWPEVLMSYDEADGTLYSADGFGKFGALSECGFYGRDDDDWACEARRYYFNIVGKFGGPVQTVLGKVGKLEVKRICPLHGPILEDHLEQYISLYNTWSNYEAEVDGVFIACASIHGGTLEAAQRLAEMLKEKGVKKVSLSDLSRSDIAENVEDAFKYSKMILAAASYDGGVFSPMHDFMHRLKIKGYSKRRVGLLENGSWAPCAARTMKEMLSEMKEIELIEPVVTIRSKMTHSDTSSLEKLCDAIIDNKS